MERVLVSVIGSLNLVLQYVDVSTASLRRTSICLMLGLTTALLLRVGRYCLGTEPNWTLQVCFSIINWGKSSTFTVLKLYLHFLFSISGADSTQMMTFVLLSFVRTVLLLITIATVIVWYCMKSKRMSKEGCSSSAIRDKRSRPEGRLGASCSKVI